MPTNANRYVCHTAPDWEAWLWRIGLCVVVVGYVATLPQAFFLFDAAKDWSQAYYLNAVGSWADHGTNITGLGNNGPLLPWLYQLVLRMWPSEFALPVVSAALSLAAFALGMVLLARFVTPNAAQRGRMAAILATSPLLFEWTRIGVDLAFLAPAIPVVAWAWFRASARQRPLDWLFLGIVLAIGTQVYVIFVAVVAGVVLAAGLAPPRVGESRCGRMVWLLLGAAMVLWPLGPQLHLQPPSLTAESRAAWAESGRALWTMLGAYPQHLAVRAAVVMPGLAKPLAALGWLVAVAPLLLLPRRRRTPIRGGVLLATYAAGLAMVAYPDSARYHHLAHAFVALVAAQIVLAAALRRSALATILVVALQAVFLGGVQYHARATGMVALGGVLPFVGAQPQTYVATLEFRRNLFAALDRAGLDDAAQRWGAVEGPWALPFVEQGWYRLGDGAREGVPTQVFSVFSGARQVASRQASPRFWLGPCDATGAMPLSRTICLSPAPTAGWRHYLPASSTRPYAVPISTGDVVRLRHIQPLAATRAIAQPPRLVSPQPLRVAALQSYVGTERTYTFPPGTTAVAFTNPSVLAWLTVGPE